jgi:hypothetical protein
MILTLKTGEKHMRNKMYGLLITAIALAGCGSSLPVDQTGRGARTLDNLGYCHGCDRRPLSAFTWTVLGTRSVNWNGNDYILTTVGQDIGPNRVEAYRGELDSNGETYVPPAILCKKPFSRGQSVKGINFELYSTGPVYFSEILGQPKSALDSICTNNFGDGAVMASVTDAQTSYEGVGPLWDGRGEAPRFWIDNPWATPWAPIGGGSTVAQPLPPSNPPSNLDDLEAPSTKK